MFIAVCDLKREVVVGGPWCNMIDVMALHWTLVSGRTGRERAIVGTRDGIIVGDRFRFCCVTDFINLLSDVCAMAVVF